MREILENRTKRKLEQGRVVSVVGGENTADFIDFLGQFGFDGAWIECEHGPVDWSHISDMTRACDLWGMSSIVRVNTNEPWLIGRTLDRGASGIVVPHVNTKEDALKVVGGAKFAPVGHRGMFGGRQSYGVAGYHAKINDQVLIVVLIEDTEAIENLQEILTVDEIDVFFVAPGDLAQSMGFVGQIKHPEVQATVDKAITDIKEAGRNPGAIVTDETVESCIEKGAMFLLPSWSSWVTNGAQQYVAKVAALAK